MELIVETHGVLVCKHQGHLRVMRDKEKLQEVPLIMLEQVLIASNGVALTSDVVRVCSENGIPIHFVSGDGRSYGTLYSSGLTGTIQTRRAQLEAYSDERGAILAHAFVRGKLENQINLLRAVAKNRRENDPDCYEETQRIVGEIRDALQVAEALISKTCDEIRQQLLAAEGRGAERYWTGVRRLLLAYLDWPGRQTQGATDPLNTALNYGYGILYARVERALILAGLDPYAGFIHTDRPGKPSLELDLIEEFRQAVVDRTILGLVNRKFEVAFDEHGRLDEATRRRLGSISRTAWMQPTITRANASASLSFSSPRRVTLPLSCGVSVKATSLLSRVGKPMRYLLIYDITEDRARTRVADLCFDYGLERIQYSAFWGDFPRTLQEELLLKIKRVLQGKIADVRLIPLCERDLARTKQLTFSEKGAARAG